MSDVFAVANLLIDNALRSHGEEIDIIGFYGSQARGDAQDGSDLDIFYIPADGTNPPVGRTFLFDGLLFDFWAIRWDTMAGFATGRIRGWAFAPALVHQAKILHARNDEQAQRFVALKQRVSDLQKPEARPEMISRAIEAFTRVAAHRANLRLAVAANSEPDIRYAGWKLIHATLECLALVNQRFFGRGLSKALSEVSILPDRPDNVEQLLTTIATSRDWSQVLKDSEELVRGTRQILRRAQATIPSDTTIREQFQQAYPEMKDIARKVLAACERGNPVAASAEAWALQSDVTMMLDRTAQGAGDGDFNLYSERSAAYRDLGFPDLMKAASSGLDALASQTRLFDERLRRMLADHSVDLCEIESLDNLRKLLSTSSTSSILSIEEN